MNEIINQQIINSIQLDYKNTSLAVFLVGAEGSGKSSLRNYLNLSDIQTNIDPDILNRIYYTKCPNNYQIKAAKQAIRMYYEALKLELNICLESTLSGHGTMERIQAAKDMGYYTIAFYIGLASVELNLKRVAMRVARGGHDIPEDSIRRRFYESENNLIKIKNSFDVINVIDNSDSYFRLQYSINNDKQKIYAYNLEPWAKSLLDRLSFKSE